MYISREDNMEFVQHPNHSHMAQFQDGTRFTVSTKRTTKGTRQVSKIVVECKGFARVHYTSSAKVCHILFPDDSSVTCFNNGSYRIEKGGDYKLDMECTGVARYHVPSAEYVLDHTKGDEVIYCKDSKGNVFSMNNIGEVTAKQENPVQHRAFMPRYFILNADKTSYELLRNSTAEDVVLRAKSSSRKNVIVKGSVPGQPDISTTTVIQPIHTPRVTPVIVPLKEDSIVPPNLRCREVKVPLPVDPNKARPKFGTLVGKGLTIGSHTTLPPSDCSSPPLALEYRQFLHLKPLTDSRRKEIFNLLTSYIHLSSEQKKKLDAMQPVDKRDESEIKLSTSLQLRPDIPGCYMRGLEHKVKQPAAVVLLPPVISQEGLAFIKKSKSELQEAEDIRTSLRNKVIPPFFKSEQFKKNPLIEPPDMDQLSNKLAHVSKIVKKCSPVVQSLSPPLVADNFDDVIQGVCTTTSSENEECLALPRSNGMQGQKLACAAVEMHPTNPTPLKASLSSKGQASQLEKESVSKLGSPGQVFQPSTPSASLSLTAGYAVKQPNIKVCLV